MLWAVAAADLRGDLRRSLITLIAVVPVVFAYLVMVGVAETLGTVGEGDDGDSLVLVSPNVLDPSTGRIDQTAIDRALAAGGVDVVSATPMMLRVTNIDGTVIQLRAAALASWGDVFGLDLLEGRAPAPGADEVAVTEGVATATGWRIGDTVRVFGTEFTVTGLVRASGTMFATLWMDLDRAARLFDAAGIVQMVVVETRPGADREAVRARMESVAEGRFAVYAAHDLTRRQAGAMDAAIDLSRLASVIAFVTLTFVAFNLTAMTLVERLGDVAVARELGWSRSVLSALVVTRSLVLTLVGYGIGLAATAAFLASRPSVVLRSFVLEPGLTLTAMGGGVLLAAVATVAGAGIAVWAAARRPVASLRRAR